MRAGRSYSPRTLVSNFIWLSAMPGCWRHVAQGRMEPPEIASQLQEYELAESLGNGLEEGSSAFTEALNRTQWGPQTPTIHP